MGSSGIDGIGAGCDLPQRAAAAGRVVLYLTASCYRSGRRLLEIGVQVAGSWNGWSAARGAAVDERLIEATGSQPPCDAAVPGRAVRCTQGRRWGTGRGGSSAGERPGRRDLRCTDDRRRPCTGADPAASDPATGDRSRRHRSRHRTRGNRGAFDRVVQRRLLVAGGRPVDAGPPLLHGVGPVQLHRVTPPLGDRRMGFGNSPGGDVPHVRERGVRPVRDCPRWSVPRVQRGVRASARGAGRSGCRHRHPARSRYLRDRGE